MSEVSARAPQASRARAFLEAVRRQMRRPVVAFLFVVASFALIAPRVGPRELKLHHKLPPGGCARKIMVAAFLDGELARTSTMLVRGEPELTHAFVLPKGRYLVRLDVQCTSGSTRAVERTLLLEENGTLDFDLTTACAC